MRKPLVQYCVWQSQDADQSGYWMFYDTIENAVDENGDGAHVYKFTGRSLGKFQKEVSFIKIKEKK